MSWPLPDSSRSGFLAVARLAGGGMGSERGEARGRALRALVFGIVIFMGVWVLAAAFQWSPAISGILRMIALARDMGGGNRRLWRRDPLARWNESRRRAEGDHRRISRVADADADYRRGGGEKTCEDLNSTLRADCCTLVLVRVLAWMLELELMPAPAPTSSSSVQLSATSAVHAVSFRAYTGVPRLIPCNPAALPSRTAISSRPDDPTTATISPRATSL